MNHHNELVSRSQKLKCFIFVSESISYIFRKCLCYMKHIIVSEWKKLSPLFWCSLCAAAISENNIQNQCSFWLSLHKKMTCLKQDYILYEKSKKIHLFQTFLKKMYEIQTLCVFMLLPKKIKLFIKTPEVDFR